MTMMMAPKNDNDVVDDYEDGNLIVRSSGRKRFPNSLAIDA
jgi:hypothetical protein